LSILLLTPDEIKELFLSYDHDPVRLIWDTVRKCTVKHKPEIEKLKQQVADGKELLRQVEGAHKSMCENCASETNKGIKKDWAEIKELKELSQKRWERILELQAEVAALKGGSQ
jgi:hypothetical protein